MWFTGVKVRSVPTYYKFKQNLELLSVLFEDILYSDVSSSVAVEWGGTAWNARVVGSQCLPAETSCLVEGFRSTAQSLRVHAGMTSEFEPQTALLRTLSHSLFTNHHSMTWIIFWATNSFFKSAVKKRVHWNSD
jgi:hypothetical protein